MPIEVSSSSAPLPSPLALPCPIAAKAAALREQLSGLTATVASINRHHYQRQFEQCWARFGGGGNGTGAASAGEEGHSGTHKSRRGHLSSAHDNDANSSHTNNNSNISNAFQSNLKRSPAVIHDLHLVGVCADHYTDDSSCDEAMAVEATRTRHFVQKLRQEETAASKANQVHANSVTAIGNAYASFSGTSVTNAQMNYVAREVAKESVQLSERFLARRAEVEERSRRRIAMIQERKRAKRSIEHGMHKALHSAPLLMKRRKRVGNNTNAKLNATEGGGAASNNSAACGSFASTSTASAPLDINTFQLASLASIRAATGIVGIGGSGSGSASAAASSSSLTPLELQLATAIDRYRNRMRHVRSLKNQPDFAAMDASEKVRRELATVMKKRREFHRARGATGGNGGAAQTNYDGEDEEFGDADE